MPHITSENRELWQNALVQMELDSNERSFKTWFLNTDILNRSTDGTINIAVPSKIIKEGLMEKKHKLILKTLRNLDPSIRAVEYTIHKSVSIPLSERKHSRSTSTPTQNTTASLNLQSVYVDRRDNLNPRYTFDSFVVGPFNQLAYAAARAVIERPGSTYNPLFIYGQTGHGKTHLIQAIGNYFKKTHTNKKVLYITSERFAIDYINSVRSGKPNVFKEQYRQHDVLIMDDVQFIANTEKTQEELFHLFNALYDNNKQIIFSSDKHPVLLNGLEDRLKSRFGAGMIAEIPEPDVESRTAIIRSKIEQHGFFLDDEIIKYLAENVRSNIREIEGILNMIVCKSQIKDKSINIADVKLIIKHSMKPARGITVEEVVNAVAKYYDIPEKSIIEKTRKKEVVKPRQIIMYLLREEYNVSFPLIGERMGGRDHTTVIHSCDKIKDELRSSVSLEQEIEQIRSIINA